MRFAVPEKFGNVVEWERGIGAPDIAIAPCRTIPITPAILEAERRRQITPVSTVADAWRSRIRSTPTSAAPARPAASSSHVARPSKRMDTMILCAGRCGRRTKPGARGGLCYSCRQWAKREATAAAKEVAPTPPEKGDSGQSPEQPPREAVNTSPAASSSRVCSRDGCTRTIRRNSRTGVCGQCAFLAREHAKYLAKRKPCVEACGRFQRTGKKARVDGRCGPCGAKLLRRDRGSEYRRRARARNERTCALCPRTLALQSKSEYCTHHLKTVKFMKVQLRPKTMDELRADLVWQNLSEADKWWLLDRGAAIKEGAQ